MKKSNLDIAETISRTGRTSKRNKSQDSFTRDGRWKYSCVNLSDNSLIYDMAISTRTYRGTEGFPEERRWRVCDAVEYSIQNGLSVFLRVLNYSKIFNCVSPRVKSCYTGMYCCLVTLRFSSSLRLRASVHAGCLVSCILVFFSFVEKKMYGMCLVGHEPQKN